MNIRHTFAAHIRAQLTQAGYTISKCLVDNVWQVSENTKELYRNKSLGDLMRICSINFGIDWRE